MMEYRGFEVYATQVPEELASNGAGKVFACCEIYRVEDTGLANVLTVFDLVEGKDIPVGSDEALISALKGYVDKHYAELMLAAPRSELPLDKVAHNLLQQIDSGRITETANAVLCFDHEDGQRVVCVDFCYDSCENLPECDVVNLLTLSATEENIALAQVVLQGIAEGWKISVHEESLQHNLKNDVFTVLRDLERLHQQEGYLVAETMWFLQNQAEPDEPLSVEEAYLLASKFQEARGSWFSTPVLHAEYLEALKDLLECGVNGHNLPSFPALSPEETRKLLLAADEQVFGTLVETAAVENCYRYAPHDYQVNQEDLAAVEKAADNIKGLVVENVLARAIQSSEKQSDGVEVLTMSNKEFDD